MLAKTSGKTGTFPPKVTNIHFLSMYLTSYCNDYNTPLKGGCLHPPLLAPVAGEIRTPELSYAQVN